MRLTDKQIRKMQSAFNLNEICRWDRSVSACCHPEYAVYLKNHSERLKEWMKSPDKTPFPKDEPASVQCENCKYSDKTIGVFAGNASDRVISRTLRGTIPVPLKGKKKVWLDNVNQKQFDSVLKEISPDIEAFYISGSPGLRDFSFLENFPKLKTVSLWWNNKAAELWDMSKTPDIQLLLLCDCNRLTDLSSLKFAKKLQQLRIYSETGVIASIDPIRNLPSLISLELYVRVADQDIRPVIQAKKLKYFDCRMDIFDINSYAMFEARRPDVFVNFYNGTSEDWHENDKKNRDCILFAGKNQGSTSYAKKEKYDRQQKKYSELKEKYREADFVPSATPKTGNFAKTRQNLQADGAGVPAAEEIDEIESLLKNYANLMMNSISKNQAKDILRDTLRKMERFQEKTGFIETEERQEIYDYISSCFKEKWYDELEEILSEADF